MAKLPKIISLRLFQRQNIMLVVREYPKNYPFCILFTPNFQYFYTDVSAISVTFRNSGSSSCSWFSFVYPTVWHWGIWRPCRCTVCSAKQHCAPEVLPRSLVLAFCHHHCHPPPPAVQVNIVLTSYWSRICLNVVSFVKDLPPDNSCIPSVCH